MSGRTQMRLMQAAILLAALIVAVGPEVVRWLAVRPNPPTDVRVE